jgi:anti-sigma factor RsiW
MDPIRHNWICVDTETYLCDYLDGTLAPNVRSQMETHSAACVDCASVVSGVSGLVRQLERLEPVAEPANLSSAILDATLGPRRGKSLWSRWIDWMSPLARPQFAYGAVSVLVTVIVSSQALGLQWHKSAATTLNPVNLVHTANRQAHQAYARGVKVVSDLRLVYEIQTRLQPDDEIEQIPEPLPVEPPGGAIVPGEEKRQRLLNISSRKHRMKDQASNVTIDLLERSPS